MMNKDILTIVILVRIDSFERLRNLELVLCSLSLMNLSVIVLEADKIPKCAALLSSFGFRYEFVEDLDSIFHRTHYLNKLLRVCESQVVGVWDTDVILTQQQVEEALESILIRNYAMSSPYNGIAYYLSENQSARYAIRREISFLQACVSDSSRLMGRPSWGGVFLVNRKIYLQCGGDNEQFYGWGPEDAERVHRMEILGYPIYRVMSAPLFHLWHSRGINSMYFSDKAAMQSQHEFVKVCSMNAMELRAYIDSWKY